MFEESEAGGSTYVHRKVIIRNRSLKFDRKFANVSSCVDASIVSVTSSEARRQSVNKVR